MRAAAGVDKGRKQDDHDNSGTGSRSSRANRPQLGGGKLPRQAGRLRGGTVWLQGGSRTAALCETQAASKLVLAQNLRGHGIAAKNLQAHHVLQIHVVGILRTLSRLLGADGLQDTASQHVFAVVWGTCTCRLKAAAC